VPLAPERRTSSAMPSPPLRGLVARHVPAYHNRPSRVLISRSSPSLACMPACPSRRRPPLPPLGEPEPQPFLLNHNTSSSHVLITLSHPSPESEPPRPLPDRRSRARSSATSPSLVTCLVPSLGHMEAFWAARG
jgi:hypothetical protein